MPRPQLTYRLHNADVTRCRADGQYHRATHLARVVPGRRSRKKRVALLASLERWWDDGDPVLVEHDGRLREARLRGGSLIVRLGVLEFLIASAGEDCFESIYDESLLLLAAAAADPRSNVVWRVVPALEGL